MVRICPRLYPLRILSRKWSYLVLRSLRHPLSFNHIKKELHVITNRVLSKELQLLQQEKLVKGKETYQLTRAGHDLLEAFEPLVAWSVKHKGVTYCPPEKSCSDCHGYPEQVKPRLLKLGK
ncbi:MAG: helix-turn-helix domain-containing protein [Candidatus Woesearchaeota archaeon]|nr:helix-turn-helix domain-containing protein [Candidatus Woesearchaeota archaeon]